MVTLKWENADRAISNTGWILLHFPNSSIKIIRNGNQATFTQLNGYTAKIIKRLASQCGAEIVKVRKPKLSQP